MKCGIVAYPLQHLGLRVCGIREVIRARIYVSQANYRIRRLATVEQILDGTAQIVSFWDSAVVEKHIETGHSPSESAREKRCQMGLERSFSFPLYENRDLQERAPRRPLLQSSSRE